MVFSPRPPDDKGVDKKEQRSKSGAKRRN